MRFPAGDHEDPELRPARAQAGDHLDAAQDGHAEVDDEQVGLQGAGRGKRRAAVVVHGHDLEVLVRFQQFFQGGRDHRVVVDDDDSEHGGSLDGMKGRTKPPIDARPILCSGESETTPSRDEMHQEAGRRFRSGGKTAARITGERQHARTGPRRRFRQREIFRTRIRASSRQNVGAPSTLSARRRRLPSGARFPRPGLAGTAGPCGRSRPRPRASRE